MVKVKNKLLLAMSLLLCAVLLSAVFVFTSPQTESSIEVKAETLTETQIAQRRANPGLYESGTTTLTTSWNDLITNSKITVTNGALKVQDGTLAGDLVCGSVNGLTSLDSAFYFCGKLTSIDCSNLDTSQVTSMRDMFYNCDGLTSINLGGNFSTISVTDMYEMFYYCIGLTSLDVSEFNTESVTNMRDMFNECSGLTSLDVSNFKTSNVTDMSWMFYKCSSLTSLDLSNFVTNKVTSMDTMFGDCDSLTNLDVSNFDTSNVTIMSWMFSGCNSLTRIKLPATMTAGQTVDLPSISSVTVTNKDHYALTESPSVAKTTFTSEDAGKVIELYDANNVSLAPAETPNTPDTPETGIVANSISILVAMVSLLGIAYVVSKKKRLSK